jgi:prefoldin subunit 5
MTKEEKQQVSKVISDYSECHNQIEKLEHDIKQLLHKKNNLVKTLKHIRNTEKHVVEKLQKKYGEDAGIDLEKLEIINGKA